MTNYYFNQENTNDFTDDEIREMNAELQRRADEVGIDLEEPENDDVDQIKAWSDQISDSY